MAGEQQLPFDGTLEEAVGDLAAQCIAARPTGALYFAPLRSLVPLTAVQK